MNYHISNNYAAKNNKNKIQSFVTMSQPCLKQALGENGLLSQKYPHSNNAANMVFTKVKAQQHIDRHKQLIKHKICQSVTQPKPF